MGNFYHVDSDVSVRQLVPDNRIKSQPIFLSVSDLFNCMVFSPEKELTIAY